MTLDEAAAALGVRWRTLRRAMIEARWLISVAPDVLRCAPGAVGAGFLAPLTESTRSLAGELVLEVGYEITATGLRELGRMLSK